MSARHPVYSTAAVGFRCWKLSVDGWLHPLHYPLNHWPREPEQSSCVSAHSAPGADCDCGWNAFHTLDEAIAEQSRAPAPALLGLKGTPEEGDEAELIVGCVAGWGDLELHRDGWRAEWARPIALLGGGGSARRASSNYSIPLINSEYEMREWVRDLNTSRISAAPQAALPATRPRNRRRRAPLGVQIADDLLWFALIVMISIFSWMALTGPDDPETLSLTEALSLTSLAVLMICSVYRIITPRSQGPISALWSIVWTRAHQRELRREGLPL